MNGENGWTTIPDGRGAFLGLLYEADVRPGGTRVTPTYTEGEGHRLIVGPTGSGKFWSAICPLLLTADKASAIVFDVAGGEAAQHTGGHRANVGDVLMLDPYGLQSDGTGALNPIDALGADDGGMVARARTLADAVMMFKSTGSDNDYWNGQARDLLAALLIHARTWPHETDRTLGRIRSRIRGPMLAKPTEDDANGNEGLGISAMARNLACDNFVRDTALNILEDVDLTQGKNVFYVRQTLRENTSFLDAPEIRRVTAKTTMDLRQLRDQVATLYIVTPAAELRQLGRWMRLMYATILPHMQRPIDAARHSDRNGIPLHIVMDEFAAFGRFERVKDDMATVRKFGIHYLLAVQKVSQLQGTYGREEWENFVPRYLQVLGSDEQATADYVSKRLGTVRKEQKQHGISRGAMGSGGTNESRSEYTARFREPHEINGMPSNGCYIAIQGSSKPLYVRKLPAYDDKALQCRLGGIKERRQLAYNTAAEM